MPAKDRRRRLPTHLRARPRVYKPAVPDGPPWRPGHYDGPTDPAGQREEARFMSTGIVPPIYQHNPGACLSLIMMAQALDIPRATAINNIWWNLAAGKGATTAQLMAGLLVERHGYQFTVTEETDARVAMTFHRTVNGRKRRLGDVEWTILEAVAACLTWRDQWRHHPKDMLWARCLMRGARRFASHVGTGLAYTRDELDDMTAPAEGGEVATAVQEIIDRATADTTTSATIRGELVGLAKKRGLLDAEVGDGETLGQVLGLLWGMRRGAETDAVQAATPAPAAADDPGPAGTGALPCGCDAAQFLHDGVHQLGVHHDA